MASDDEDAPALGTCELCPRDAVTTVTGSHDGETRTGAVCPRCRDNIDAHNRGEDVDWSYIDNGEDDG